MRSAGPRRRSKAKAGVAALITYLKAPRVTKISRSAYPWNFPPTTAVSLSRLSLPYLMVSPGFISITFSPLIPLVACLSFAGVPVRGGKVP